MIQQQYIDSFVSRLNPKFADKISIGNNEFRIINKCDRSINNQEGNLRDDNYLGREFEYTLKNEKLEIPITIQLYENVSGHYRLFCYTKNNKMLSSFNLSTGYNEGVIDIKLQIKVSTQKLTKEEREQKRDYILQRLEEEGLSILPKNIVYLGTYDPKDEVFIDTTPEKLMIDFLKICILKGDFNI
ncbi:hypothetical protein J0L31_08085 [Terrisporobacter glycolicus]|nr:hypothetical protein [Terrisporobacter glycolicus]